MGSGRFYHGVRSDIRTLAAWNKFGIFFLVKGSAFTEAFSRLALNLFVFLLLRDIINSMIICSLQSSLGNISNNFKICASSLSDQIKNIAIRIFYQAMDSIYEFGYHVLGVHFNIGTNRLIEKIRMNHESYNDVPNFIRNNFEFKVRAVEANGLALEYIPKNEWEFQISRWDDETLRERAIVYTPAALRFVSEDDRNRVYYGLIAAKCHGSKALEYYPFSSSALDTEDDLNVVKKALSRNSFDHLRRIPLRVLSEYLKINWKAIFYLPIETVIKDGLINIATQGFIKDRSSWLDKFKGIIVPEHNRTEAFAIAMIPLIVEKERTYFGIETRYRLDDIGLDSREIKDALSIYLEDDQSVNDIYFCYKHLAESNVRVDLFKYEYAYILSVIKQCRKYGKEKYVGKFSELLRPAIKKNDLLELLAVEGLLLEYFPQYQNDRDIVSVAIASNPLAIRFASTTIKLGMLIDQFDQKQFPESYLERHSKAMLAFTRVIESGF
jgi:hypothetical protein